MDVIIDKVPARDPATIDFSDIVAASYAGFDHQILDNYPEPGTSTDAWIFHFTGDLTDAEIKAVWNRVTTTPAEETMRQNMALAISVNDAFLALSAPTNAQLVTQLRRLTRENTAMIKLWLGELDDASGT